jgi:hypothetical protein
MDPMIARGASTACRRPFLALATFLLLAFATNRAIRPNVWIRIAL